MEVSKAKQTTDERVLLPIDNVSPSFFFLYAVFRLGSNAKKGYAK